MDIRKISPECAVSSQITVGDLADIRDAGFRGIVCNRPDGETADQPSFDEIRTAAQALGIDACHVPVQSGMVREEDVATFAAAIARMPRPFLTYCRSGARSETLWSLFEISRGHMPHSTAARGAAD